MTHIDKETLMKYKKEELIGLIYDREDNINILSKELEETTKLEKASKEATKKITEEYNKLLNSSEYNLSLAIKEYMKPYMTKDDVDNKINKYIVKNLI